MLRLIQTGRIRRMSKYLDRARELRATVTPHYNCAQSVLLPFAEEAGIDEETALKMAANFGGGMRIASACGAFTGAIMALGLMGYDDPAMVTEVARRIKSEHEGFIDCKDLLKLNHDKGLEKKPHCDSMVFECVGIVEDIAGLKEPEA